LILLDANLLLYITIKNYPQHPAAAIWFEQQVDASVRIGMPWPSLLAFLRIGTNPRVYESPLSINTAWAQIEAWLTLHNTWIPQPTDQHQCVLSRLLSETQATANLIPDVHLAALAIEHDLEVCTTDADFARFSGCKWRNPLKEN
jgi:uncharacterized protein